MKTPNTEPEAALMEYHNGPSGGKQQRNFTWGWTMECQDEECMRHRITQGKRKNAQKGWAQKNDVETMVQQKNSDN